MKSLPVPELSTIGRTRPCDEYLTNAESEEEEEEEAHTRGIFECAHGINM